MGSATPFLQQPFDDNEECIKNDAVGKESALPDTDALIDDLSMTELNQVHSWLSIAGSLDHYVPLHHQLVLQREIVASDSARLHMLWFGRTIYIKPLPKCLMNATFIRDRVCRSPDLHPLVIGFLLSYCKLVKSPLDLNVAKTRSLLPQNIEWDQWELFRQAILSCAGKGAAKNQRYLYGELRIGRLDIIYRLTMRGVNYFTVHREYSSYFSQYFSLFITVFAFATTILQAMQVGLALGDDTLVPPMFRMVCYVVSAGTLIGIAAALIFVTLLFFVMLVANAYITLRAHLKYHHPG